MELVTGFTCSGQWGQGPCTAPEEGVHPALLPPSFPQAPSRAGRLEAWATQESSEEGEGASQENCEGADWGVP